MARRTAFLPDASIDFDRWTKGNRQHDVSSRVLCVVSHSHGAGPTHVRRLQFRRSEVNARCPCHVALVSETFRLNAASFLAFRAEEFVVLGRQSSLGNSGKGEKAEGIRGPFGWIRPSLVVRPGHERRAWWGGSASVQISVVTRARSIGRPASLLLTEREGYCTAAPALLYALYNVRD
jgi:hypothetical protein